LQKICEVCPVQKWQRGLNSKLLVMPDQAQKNRPVAPSGGGGGEGPSSPKVDKPNTEELLKRMRKVDPDQAKRYRQRTGE
jgi:hypothetical protein